MLFGYHSGGVIDRFCGYFTRGGERDFAVADVITLLSANSRRLVLSVGQTTTGPTSVSFQFGPFGAFPVAPAQPQTINHFTIYNNNVPDGRSLHYDDYGPLMQMEVSMFGSLGVVANHAEIMVNDTQSVKIPEEIRCLPLAHRIRYSAQIVSTTFTTILGSNPRRVMLILAVSPTNPVEFFFGGAVAEEPVIIMDTSGSHKIMTYLDYGPMIQEQIVWTSPLGGVAAVWAVEVYW